MYLAAGDDVMSGITFFGNLCLASGMYSVVHVQWMQTIDVMYRVVFATGVCQTQC
jgi:hypothetical protein